MRRFVIAYLLAGAVVSLAQNDAGPASRQRNKDLVQSEYRENLAAFGGKDRYMVSPGLLADREARRVLLRAEATGLAKDNTVEFILIGENSSHDYEALAVSFAKPGDIHRALCFIGMAPGRPVDASRLQFWPKGERVIMKFTSDIQTDPVAAERLMLNRQTGRPLEECGFVFTGSKGFRPGEEPGALTCIADLRDPMSIAANYNEPESVLDVPRQAAQSEVYENQVVNSAYVFDHGEFLGIIIEPERKDGSLRVVDLLLAVNPGNAGTNEPAHPAIAAGLLFDVTGTGRSLIRGGSLSQALETFTTLVEDGHDPFVTVRFDNRLRLGDVKSLCSVIAAIDNESGIRVEPPLKGRLYYRAFLPGASFRNREERLSQPWELRLKTESDGITGVLTQIEEVWREGNASPDLKLHHFPIPTPTALRRTLDEKGPGLPVIMIFAEPELLYGQLLEFIAPALPTHGTVYVFTD